MNRREFLQMSTGLCLATSALEKAYGAASELDAPKVQRRAAKLRNRTPYKGLDWTMVRHVNTTSHGHCMDDVMLKSYTKRNWGLYTISNYYPSAPTMPGKTFTRYYYRMHHDWPLTVNGKRVAGPFDWNKIIAPWAKELDPKFGRQYPFKEGPKMFSNFPDGVLEAPNAEHHCFFDEQGNIMWPLHVCAPGSNFKSGTFDAHFDFQTKRAGFMLGDGEPWQIGFDRLIDGFVVSDGGGITINHPFWSHHPRELLLKLLDHDERVLGIEVLENGHNSERHWDWILATGRQCFGFFVPDWGALPNQESDNSIFGVNVLVVPEYTVEACLRAYRRGDFYGATRGFGELKFTSISFGKDKIEAKTDKLAKFEIITARGVVHTCEGTSVSWAIPPKGPGCGWTGRQVDIFARLRATASDGCGEVLYSQPIMLD